MRLQVFLSHNGVCSRRQALDYIFSGRVCVDGIKVTEPSSDVDPLVQRVDVDGRPVRAAKKIYILLHKPAGVVSTVRDRFADKTVLDLLPRHLRGVYPVGRLDKDTTGLLLLTNDGDLTHQLLHPSFEVKKVYQATLDRNLDAQDRLRLERGVLLEGKKTHPCRLKKTADKECIVTIHEGRKRQIRRMFDVLRYRVTRLKRLQHGLLELGSLAEGQWRYLSRSEVERLFRSVPGPLKNRPRSFQKQAGDSRG